MPDFATETIEQKFPVMEPTAPSEPGRTVTDPRASEPTPAELKEIVDRAARGEIDPATADGVFLDENPEVAEQIMARGWGRASLVTVPGSRPEDINADWVKVNSKTGEQSPIYNDRWWVPKQVADHFRPRGNPATVPSPAAPTEEVEERVDPEKFWANSGGTPNISFAPPGQADPPPPRFDPIDRVRPPMPPPRPDPQNQDEQPAAPKEEEPLAPPPTPEGGQDELDEHLAGVTIDPKKAAHEKYLEARRLIEERKAFEKRGRLAARGLHSQSDRTDRPTQRADAMRQQESFRRPVDDTNLLLANRGNQPDPPFDRFPGLDKEQLPLPPVPGTNTDTLLGLGQNVAAFSAAVTMELDHLSAWIATLARSIEVQTYTCKTLGPTHEESKVTPHA